MEKQSAVYDFPYLKEVHSTRNFFMTDVGIGFTYRELEKGKSFGCDQLPSHQLLMFLEGSCTLNYDRFVNREFSGKQMVLIPRLSCYVGHVSEPLKLLIMSFEIPMRNYDRLVLQTYYTFRLDMEYNFFPTPIRCPMDRFLELLVYCLKKNVDSTFLQELKHQELFLYLRKFYTKEEVTYLFYEILGRSLNFREFIFDNYMQVNTLNELIDLSNMSRAVFFRKFKDEFKETAYQWMLKHKCRQIAQYLTQTDSTIKEVVNKFRFSSFSNFNRFCKRNFGCNPKQLVERFRQVDGV